MLYGRVRLYIHPFIHYIISESINVDVVVSRLHLLIVLQLSVLCQSGLLLALTEIPIISI